MVLVGFVGELESGKTTAARCIPGAEILSFSTPLKEISRIAFGFSEQQVLTSLKDEKDDFWGITPRKVLQFLGTEIFRNQIQEILPNVQEDFWVILAKKRLASVEGAEIVIFDDVRFQNEADFIHQRGGILIKIIRPKSEPKDQHISELSVKNIKADFEILNDSSIESLEEKVREIVKF